MDTLVRGLSTTVIGIVTVIVILIVIALVITLMGHLMRKNSEKALSAGTAPEVLPEPGTAEPAPQLTNDYELVAAITAAISAYTGMSPQRFKIFDIKPSDTEAWRKANRKSF